MERKFRIIEEIYYDTDYNEHTRYFVQEWKQSRLGYWRWKYWKYPAYFNRVFGTKESAKEMIKKYINKFPYKIIAEELVY